MHSALPYSLLGDSAVQVHVGERIDDACLQKAQAFAAALHELALPGITDIVPAYTSVTIHYDALALPVVDDVPPMAVLTAAIEEALACAARPVSQGRPVEIPVCYGGEYGPDLASVAQLHGLQEAQLIELHSTGDYRVAMLGFAPGFCYLSGLSEQLATPRRALPRARVPAGSVAIGGQQTGIYPADLPGGWQIIGRTPVRMFDVLRDPPSRVQAGDRLRFVVLTHNEWPRT